MSRFCEIRLVDLVVHTKTATKHKKDMSELGPVDNKPKRNKRESVFSNKGSIMPAITENIRNKSKSRPVLRTSKRIINGSHQQSNAGIENGTHSDSLKLNTSVEACGLSENIKLYNPKLGCQVVKRGLGEAGKKISSLKKPKTNLNIDTNLINSNEESNYNIHKGYTKKKKKKSKTHHKFWESNLTGARRVSKRLTNLKFKNKHSMNPKTASEKYIFTNISHWKYNQEKKSRVQRSVIKHGSKKKLKMNSNNTVKESLSPRNQTMLSETRTLTKYGRLSHKTHLLPNVLVSNQHVLPQKILSPANFHPKKVESDEFCDPTKFCEREDNKPFISSISAVLKSGTEETSCSSVEQEEGAYDLIHIDLEIKKTADLYPTVEDNSFSSNKITDTVINNTTETVTFNEIQKEYKENTENIIIETEKGISSYIPEKYDDTISSEYLEERDNKENKTNETTCILIPSSLMPSDENHMTSLECNTASFSENAVNDEITVTNVKDTMDFIHTS